MKLVKFRPRWTYAASLTRTKLPQFASLVPVLGYAVLWGDSFQALMMRFSSLGPLFVVFSFDAHIPPLFGGVYVLIGLLIFWSACPRPLRLYRSRREYVEAVTGDRDSEECVRAGKALPPLRESIPMNDRRERVIFGILVADEELGVIKREPSAVTARASIAPLTLL